MEPVRLVHEGPVARLTLMRGAKRNAINLALREVFLAVLLEAEASDASALLFDAEGAGFCAGQNLEERRAIAEGGRLDLGAALREGINRMVLGLEALPQPVVVAVQGDAIGAGAGLALAGDLVFMADSARLHFSFAALGLGPDAGTSFALARAGRTRVGAALFEAGGECRQGCRMGACHRGGAADALVVRSAAAAKSVAALPANSTKAIKRLLREAPGRSLAAQLEAEAAAPSYLGHAPDYAARLPAFFARR